MKYFNESLINLSSVKYNDIEGFSLYVSDSGNFISNGEIKFNCSNLVTSAIDGEVFFTIKFTPDGIPIYIPYRLFDIFFYDKIAESISEKGHASSFVQNFINSFRCNNWFSLAWINRLIAKMKLKLGDKAILMYKINGLNIIQLISLYKTGIIKYSSDKLLKIVPYEIAQTSNKILSLTDITNILGERISNFTEVIRYFEIPENIINEVNDLEVPDTLGLSIFNINLYNTELREQVYKNMDKAIELNEDVYKYFAVRFREIENELRYNLGYNSVGSLFTETLLFNKIKKEFPRYQVISQFSPTWLSPQRFDIFIKEKRCAIEYNGIQHYEPIDYFGGEEGFKRTKKRDIAKRKKCKENNCNLIEIKYDEDFESAVQRICLKIELLP